MFHKRTKYIDVRHHFVRDSLCAGMFKVCDILTKPVTKDKHEWCVSDMNLLYGIGSRVSLRDRLKEANILTVASQYIYVLF